MIRVKSGSGRGIKNNRKARGNQADLAEARPNRATNPAPKKRTKTKIKTESLTLASAKDLYNATAERTTAGRANREAAKRSREAG